MFTGFLATPPPCRAYERALTHLVRIDRLTAISRGRSLGAVPEPQGATDRAQLIANLEQVRERKLITYVTSTRPGYPGGMGADAIPVIYEHLRTFDFGEGDGVDLFLHTDGGEATVPWRLMNLLREFADGPITLLVPHHAYSAGTLTALGADEVIMHPMGVLGPTDTSVNGPFNPAEVDGPPMPIQVEDVSSYVEWVKQDIGISHEDELVQALGFLTERVNPLALGGVKRSVLQSRMMGEKLLAIRSETQLDKHSATEIVSTLAQRLFYHGHPINRREAREELNLNWVRDASDDEEDAMWALYKSYADQMDMEAEFSPLREAIKGLGDIPAVPQYDETGSKPPPTVINADLPTQQLAWVESKARADCREEEMNVTLSRTADGAVTYRYLLRADAWRQAR